MSKASDFKKGDRVWHVSRQEYGTVSKIGEDGSVFVTFESGKGRGEYDHTWFRIHPDMLRHAKEVDQGRVG